MIAMVSYQAPTSALPKAGLAASVSVLTTIRSMISPGICELSNSLVAPGNGRDLGQQRVPGDDVLDVVGAEVKTETMSASEVLTTPSTSRSARPACSSARASR